MRWGDPRWINAREFDHFKAYPPELIDRFNVESDPDTGEFFAASIDFYGGTYTTVSELDF